MKKQHLLSYLLLWIAAITIPACQKEKQQPIASSPETFDISETVVVPETDGFSARGKNSHNNSCNTFYGSAVQMGNGHVRSWINIRKSDNKPLALGIEMTDCSLQNLSMDPLNFAGNTFFLALHPKALSTTPFNHIAINWEPAGHEPPGIYDVPHFDMHFYKISVAERLAITGVPGLAPPAGYLPAAYVIQAATVPQMGTHWIDPSSPELPPTLSPFTYTFIYGSNNGKTIFNEPMITRAFMLSGASVSKAFPQPLLFTPNNTYYPTVYKIWKNTENDRHYVALTDFVWR